MSKNYYAPLEDDILKQTNSKKKIFTIVCTTTLAFIITLLLLLFFIPYLILDWKYPIDADVGLHYWDWTKIDTTNLRFPRNFTWGTATSAHQVEGNCNNNQWWQFEKSINPITKKSPIDNGDVSGQSADEWNLYKQDIQLMKNVLNTDTYRFSIEWSKIEPMRGVYNTTAIDHYHDVIDTLLSHNITPMITLHHFTDPIWFTNMGGFENVSNIDHFVNFTDFAFRTYSSKVHRWCTINEPNVYALMGWATGEFPPGKTDTNLAGIVMRNLADAHVRVYQRLKNLPGGNVSQIGIVINWNQFDPMNPHSALDRFSAQMIQNVYTTNWLQYFQTGNFYFFQPFTVDIRFSNPSAIGSNDYFGINYYTSQIVEFKLDFERPFEFVSREEDTFTDLGWAIYPEGIYRAIKQVSVLGLPMVITENGLADSKDVHREQFFTRYLYAVRKAMHEGYDVREYIVWSVIDNFEWAKGFAPRFGLFSVNYTTQERTLRNGSNAFIDIVNRSKR